MSREEALKVIWGKMHSDFKCIRDDGLRWVLVLRKGGTTLVPLDDLSDAEIVRLLPSGFIKA